VAVGCLVVVAGVVEVAQVVHTHDWVASLVVILITSFGVPAWRWVLRRPNVRELPPEERPARWAELEARVSRPARLRRGKGPARP
jgi:hypothetical protein